MAARVSQMSGRDATQSLNDLGGYSLMQAESKEALAATLKDHPHFMTPDSTIDVIDLIPLPGM